MLNPNFRDILSIFIGQKVEFLVVGAYALAAHGLPRATGDLDLWVRPSPENARKVMKALASFGAPLDQINEEDFCAPGVVFQIGVAPNRIDILTEIDGVEFADAWADHYASVVGDMNAPIISRQHLILNKRAIGRTKDLADAEWLEGHTG